MDKTSILIVEDDEYINGMLKDLLSQNNYITNSAFSGTEALLCIEKNNYSLIILDLMLPGISGEEVLNKVREVSNVPIIGLSAKDNVSSKINLLKNGADDYITKPFNTDELLVRIETILRRNSNVSSQLNKILLFKDLILNQSLHEVKLNNEVVNFTKSEYLILELLLSNTQKVFSKNLIYESVYNDSVFTEDNAINVHISNIRRKLYKINPNIEYIQTVWGIGFKMKI